MVCFASGGSLLQSLPVGQTFDFGMIVVRELQCLRAHSLRQVVLEILVPYFSFPSCHRVLQQFHFSYCPARNAFLPSPKGFTVPLAKCPPHK